MPIFLSLVFEGVGIDLSKPTTLMCNSGMGACSLLMAAHICGCQDVKVYMVSISHFQTVETAGVQVPQILTM